jgi:hypothetical protein
VPESTAWSSNANNVLAKQVECTDCDKLRGEIARLHAIITELRIESNQESNTSSLPVASVDGLELVPGEDVVESSEWDAAMMAREPQDAMETKNSALVEVEVKAAHNDQQSASSALSFVPQGRALTRRHSVAFELSVLEQLPPPLAIPEQSCVRHHFRHRHSLQDVDSNQIYHEQSFQAFLGPQEPSPTSLDALFKYAIVIAGPPPAKPRRNLLTAISERLRGADFRRTRSMPEGQAPPRSEPASMELTTFAIDSPTPTKIKAQAGGSWLMRARALPTETVTEEPSPLASPALLSPPKRTGWFSNLMTNGLRGGSGSTTPLSPSSALSPTRAGEPPETPKTNPIAAKMLAAFPPDKDAAGVPELEGLVEICFPYGDKQPRARDFSLSQLKRTLQERHRTFRSADATFVLTLASTNAARPADLTYAICVRCPLFPDEEDQPPSEDSQASASAPLPAQCCICLLTPYPFFNLFFKVLYGIAVLWDVKRCQNSERSASRLSIGSVTDTDQDDDTNDSFVQPLGLQDFIAHFHEVMGRLRDMRFPHMGGWSRMMLSPDITQLSFHRPHSEDPEQERRVLLLEYAAPVLFGLLSVDQVLFLLGCLCCERKVLLVSDHVNYVSACVLALTTLLSPLQWAGPVITVLPPRLEELLEAPVPLIAGRVSTPTASGATSVPMRGVIEMNMDRNDLRMHEEDMMVYHELKLPDCDELVHELSRHTQLLFQRHDEPDFPSAQQAESCELVCARIRGYIASICALAIGKEEADAGRLDALASTGTDNMTTGSGSRCSTLVGAFVEQLRQTQMFSEFRLHHHERSAGEGGDGDDDEDADDDTNIEDLKESEVSQGEDEDSHWAKAADDCV